MKILQIYNRYHSLGGEDTVVDAELALLREHGHELLVWRADSRAIQNWQDKIGAGLRVTYAPGPRRELARRLAESRPDIVHVHNFFPLLSPSIYYACQDAGVPVVQTLHNYRLLCPNALFFRDRHVCEDCLQRSVPWSGVWHACYRRSRPATAAVGLMLTVHRALRTWTRRVNLYIALTEFARMKFIVGGLPAGRVVVKPNFVPRTPPVGTGDGGFALYVGRLSEEKGVPILLRAWARLAEELPLRVVGDGPLADTVMAAARQQPGLTYLGRQSPEQVLALMGRAKLLVVPSVCYENFPMVVAEAYAVGLPVVASDLGSLADLVSHGRTGRLFRAGNPASLLAEVEYLHEHPAELASLRQTARAEFEQKYAAERNHEMLLRIYQTALASPPPT